MPEGAGPAPTERRANHVLREVLDELIEHVRQQRLEWLADEVWHLALKGEDEAQ